MKSWEFSCGQIPLLFFCNIHKGTQQALTKCMLHEERLSGFPKTTQMEQVGEGGLNVPIISSYTPVITQSASFQAEGPGFQGDMKGMPGR